MVVLLVEIFSKLIIFCVHSDGQGESTQKHAVWLEKTIEVNKRKICFNFQNWLIADFIVHL